MRLGADAHARTTVRPSARAGGGRGPSHDACTTAQQGHTALHLAALWGHSDAAAALVRRGASVAVGDSEDAGTPLHAAARRGHPATVTELLRLGADVFATDNVRFVAFCVRLSVRFGAVTRGGAQLGRTPLDVARAVLEAETGLDETPPSWLSVFRDTALALAQAEVRLPLLGRACWARVAPHVLCRTPGRRLSPTSSRWVNARDFLP